LVRELVGNDITLQDALQRGYANISAVARQIRPAIEESSGVEVKLETLITSLKRTRSEYSAPAGDIQIVVAKSVVNVRTDVAKLAIEKRSRTLEAIGKAIAKHQADFIHLSEGISTVTLIFDRKILDEIRALLKDDIVEEEKNLAAIIVHSPEKIIKTPGCAITFYNQVSRRRINIEDTTSCYTDTIIVVNMEDVGRAFTALTELISAARKIKRDKARIIS
jgi:aspartokinase